MSPSACPHPEATWAKTTAGTCPGPVFQPLFTLDHATPRFRALSCRSLPRSGGERAPRSPSGGASCQSDPDTCLSPLARVLDVVPEVDLFLGLECAALADDEQPPALLVAAVRGAVAPGRLVLELSRHADSSLDMLERIRAHGVRVAVDNVSLSQESMLAVLGARPDYLRIGPPLVSGCGDDFFKRAILEALGALAWKFGAAIVADGVTSRNDLACLCDLGVALVQGSWLFPPVGLPELHQHVESRRLAFLAPPGAAEACVPADPTRWTR